MKNYSGFLKLIVVSVIFLFSMPVLFAQEPGSSLPAEKSTGDSAVLSKHGISVKQSGKDSVVIYINKHDIPDFKPPCCPFKHYGKKKYNGHWAGVDLGINGFVNDNFNMTLPQEYRFMDINTARSLQVNLNPFELNLNLARNHFGLTSGLGFQFNNYVFSDKNYYLSSDYPKLTAFRIFDNAGRPVSLQNSKMTVIWLNVPVLLEYQTNNGIRWNSFHISAGVIGGARIGQYTKQYYTAINIPFMLQDLNGNPAGSFSTDRLKTWDHSQYHLNPFKLDVTARIGWSFLNFWANYSLFPLFADKQGPEVYPWAIGITLIGW